VLYQLRLLPDRREERTPLFDPEAAPEERRSATPRAQGVRSQAAGSHATPQTAHAGHAQIADVQIERPMTVVGEIETAVRNAIAPALKEHSAELRRYVAASLETLARRVIAEHTPGSSQTEPETAGSQATATQPTAMRWPLLAAISAVAILPTVVLAVLYTRTLQSTQALTQSNAHLASVVEEQQSQLATLQQAARDATIAAAAVTATPAIPNVAREVVPYGEAPLAGARLERLRGLLADLKASGFRGKLKVATYVGEFCLTGNGIEGYSMAADDLPVRRCDLVGNPFEDGLTNAQRQSLGFANLVSSMGQQTADAVTIEVANAGRLPNVTYPEGEALAKTTAGEWNHIAAQNNRVEFVPEGASE
jgi:hypothetical protein